MEQGLELAVPAACPREPAEGVGVWAAQESHLRQRIWGGGGGGGWQRGQGCRAGTSAPGRALSRGGSVAV